MKASHYLTITFLFFSFLGFSQRDQIITQAGQTIRCKILEESPSRFTYAYVDPSGNVKQSQIFKTLVKSFAYQFYSEDISRDKLFQVAKKETEVSRFEAPKKAAGPPPPPKKLKPLPAPKEAAPIQKVDEFTYRGIQVGIRGGLSNYTVPLLGLNSTSLPYYEGLSRGYSAGMEIIYFANKLIGFGVVGIGTQSQASGTNVDYYNGFAEAFLKNDLQTTRQVLYLGPALYLRHVLDPKAMVYTRLSGGTFIQRDFGQYAVTPYNAQGQNFGGSAAVGFDFLLGKTTKKSGLALNLEASYFYMQQNQLDFGEGPKSLPSPLDLNHFAISLGIKWTRFPNQKQ
ncbi:MAG: hypothetical protein ACK4LB_12120 [Spirosomataceae bacterium]